MEKYELIEKEEVDEDDEPKEDESEEVKSLSEQVKIMKESNLTGLPQYKILKQKLREAQGKERTEEYETSLKEKEKEYERISKATGVPIEQVKKEIKRKEAISSLHEIQTLMMR